MARKKTTKKSTASKNNKKLENLNYTDGVDSKTKDIDKIKNLESLLGVKSSNAYGTRDRDVFEGQLADMTMTDLQTLAVRVGVFPSGTRSSLKNKLLKQFLTDTRGGTGVILNKDTQKKLDLSDPKQARCHKLMNEGL